MRRPLYVQLFIPIFDVFEYFHNRLCISLGMEHTVMSISQVAAGPDRSIRLQLRRMTRARCTQVDLSQPDEGTKY